MVHNNDKLIPFFKGTGTDQSGRYIQQIISFSDMEMEDIHDYIHMDISTKNKKSFQP